MMKPRVHTVYLEDRKRTVWTRIKKSSRVSACVRAYPGRIARTFGFAKVHWTLYGSLWTSSGSPPDFWIPETLFLAPVLRTVFSRHADERALCAEQMLQEGGARLGAKLRYGTRKLILLFGCGFLAWGSFWCFLLRRFAERFADGYSRYRTVRYGSAHR